VKVCLNRLTGHPGSGGARRRSSAAIAALLTCACAGLAGLSLLAGGASAASGLALPDGRSFELVTPPHKGGASVEALTREGGLILGAEDGQALTYVVSGPLGEEVEGNRTPEMQQVLATRTPAGWSSQDIATPHDNANGFAPGNAPEYQFFSSELSLALVEPVGATPEPPLAEGVTQATMYLRDNATATYLPLVTQANTAEGTQFGGRLEFVSATPDLGAALISSRVALAGPESSPGLYEWSAGKLQYVSVLPDGEALPAAEPGFYHAVLHNAISSDGSRIIFTDKEDLVTRGGHLYMRDTARGETLQLDAAQGVKEPASGSAQFQAASGDGSRVLFTDKYRLTESSKAEPKKGEPDLYECTIVEAAEKLTCQLTDLTAGEGPANVQGLMLGASEDGATAFIVATGVLSENENGNGETAAPGANNLYEIAERAGEWQTTFIGTLSAQDNPEWGGNANGDTAYVTARVSPNGRYFAFMSATPMTGYDNVDASPAAEGARDEEVFLYDTSTDELRCVSCNPSGPPHGVLDTERAGEGLGLLVDRRLVWGREKNEHWIAGNIPGWTAQTIASALFQSRYLADDGRLYFNSPDDLVPAATNGKEDVYEYEPAGVGSCESPTGGCVSLISGGGSDRESAFLEATPDGSSVFFMTESRLLAQDTDTAFDIYDARECSALSPCLTLASPPPPCAETEACRPAPPPQAIAGSYATTVVTASGNIAAAPGAGVLAESQGKTVPKKKPLTRAQKLKRALKSCRKHHAHAKKKRAACERSARKRYGKHKRHKQRAKHGTAHRPAARGGARR
jgi:hypothetical protein